MQLQLQLHFWFFGLLAGLFEVLFAARVTIKPDFIGLSHVFVSGFAGEIKNFSHYVKINNFLL